MSHGPSDVDLEAALKGEFPPPYCLGAWKQTVSALVLTAIVVFGMSIHAHYSKLPQTPEAPLALDENRAAIGQTPATALSAPSTSPAPNANSQMVSVAGMSMPGSPVLQEGAFRLVGREQRTSFNTAAKVIRPSVVGIRATLRSPTASRLGQERVGSGVIVDSRGYVVTCHHVVAGATAILVSRFRQPDVQVPAELVAVQSDLALLRMLQGGPFPAATLGDSNTAEVGDWVLAVGHPFGLGLTVTAGIVGRTESALNVPGGQRFGGLLQTDAPINEGSSGGPLVNLSGEVVGINMAIYAPTGVFSGAGFSIPSNRVRDFMSMHLGVGKSGGAGEAAAVSPARNQGWWGVTLQNLPASQAALLGFGLRGVVVRSVTPNSPAHRAQLAQGDVITSVEGRPVADVDTVQLLQKQLGSTQALSLQVWRQGRARMLWLRPEPTPVAG